MKSLPLDYLFIYPNGRTMGTEGWGVDQYLWTFSVLLLGPVKEDV